MTQTLASVRADDHALPFVEASLLYRARTLAGKATAGSAIDLPPEATIDTRTVHIHDARELGPLSIETDGFTKPTHKTAVTNLYDGEQIERVYRHETEELVKELTGAERVLTFRWKWRSSSEEKRTEVWVEDPVRGVPHIDYNEATVRCFVRDIVGEAEAGRLLRQRHALINVWRPIARVECKPLTLCDPRSVRQGDLMVNTVIPPARDTTYSFPLAGYNLMFDPAHRWHYFPLLQPDEPLVFKLCDSDETRPQWTAHTSFDDPTSPPDAAPRESFEIRTIAFYPD